MGRTSRGEEEGERGLRGEEGRGGGEGGGGCTEERGVALPVCARLLLKEAQAECETQTEYKWKEPGLRTSGGHSRGYAGPLIGQEKNQ